MLSRTIDGFRTLIQKEFVAFGHMCRKRLGTVAYADQRSPCLLQFFECVHHIRSQVPTEFEFNDEFLVTLATLADSELFMNSLDCQEMRVGRVKRVSRQPNKRTIPPTPT